MDGSNPVSPPAPPPVPTPPLDVEKTAGNFVKLRDKIHEIEQRHEKELEPYKALKTKLQGMILNHLNTNNTKSARTEAGTVTATTRSSASVQDTEAFRNFIITNNEWDLADIKANAPAVFDYMAAKGQPVPGVKTSQMQTLSVRRAS